MSLGTLVEPKVSGVSTVLLRKKWYGSTEAYFSRQTMLALEGPQVCATGATTPAGRDCASEEAARASSMVAWPGMVDVQAVNTVLILFQRN